MAIIGILAWKPFRTCFRLAGATGQHAGRNRGADVTDDKDQRRLNRRFDRIERGMPGSASRWLAFLRRPAMLFVRVPLGILLVLGGIFSFLPVLGLWMLPLGLLLLALDLRFLRAPLNRVLLRVERWWQTRKRGR